jgi:hypothetical protein
MKLERNWKRKRLKGGRRMIVTERRRKRDEGREELEEGVKMEGEAGGRKRETGSGSKK